jgi:hypothetical protein
LNGNAGPKDPRDGAKVIIVNSQTEKEKVHAKVVNEKGKLETRTVRRSGRLKLTHHLQDHYLGRCGEKADGDREAR